MLGLLDFLLSARASGTWKTAVVVSGTAIAIWVHPRCPLSLSRGPSSSLWSSPLGHEQLRDGLPFNLDGQQERQVRTMEDERVRGEGRRTSTGSRMKSSMIRAFASRSVGF